MKPPGSLARSALAVMIAAERVSNELPASAERPGWSRQTDQPALGRSMTACHQQASRL